MSDLPERDETEREDESQVTADGDPGRGQAGDPPGPIDEELIDPPDR